MVEFYVIFIYRKPVRRHESELRDPLITECQPLT